MYLSKPESIDIPFMTIEITARLLYTAYAEAITASPVPWEHISQYDRAAWQATAIVAIEHFSEREPMSDRIRIGDRVRHVKRPELGIGTVWELRHSGRASVRWDNQDDTGHKRDRRANDGTARDGDKIYRDRFHYAQANLERAQ